MANKVYLGFGSNKGDRINYIKNAFRKISDSNKIKILVYSSIYESSPYGKTDQGNFLNCVAKIETELTPPELFNFLKKIETETGRLETERWGEREIDIDILFFNDQIINSEFLTVPHKDLLSRDFVLAPMCEIEPAFRHPFTNKLLNEHLNSITENHILSKEKIDLFAPEFGG